MKLETNNLVCTVPPHIFVGYLDIIRDGLDKSLHNLEHNRAIQAIADHIHEGEKMPMIDLAVGLDSLIGIFEALKEVHELATTIRTNIAFTNGVPAECQFTTPAFTANLIMDEINLT